MSENEVKSYRQHRFERPKGATEILLVRHGESSPATPGKPFPLVDGHGDPPLSEIGFLQAERVGERLKGEAIDAIYVTSLTRTVQTAAPLSRHKGLSPITEPDLREVHLGEWEGGLFRVKAAESDPVFLRMQEKERWDVIPGAEPLEMLTRRVRGALDKIVAAHPDQMIAAFVHGGIIGHILASASGSRPFAFNGADNGSISHIVVLGERIVVRRFNDHSHLEGLSSDGALT